MTNLSHGSLVRIANSILADFRPSFGEPGPGDPERCVACEVMGESNGGEDTTVIFRIVGNDVAVIFRDEAR